MHQPIADFCALYTTAFVGAQSERAMHATLNFLHVGVNYV